MQIPHRFSIRFVLGLILGVVGLAQADRISAAPETNSPPAPPLGAYFAKKSYSPQPLPQFAALRDQLPAPICDDHPLWIQVYWKAWKLAFKNFHEPAPQSGFVSQFIDAAFNQNIFLWDTCFLTMFCNPAHPLVPGIGSLDNFYARQHADGEICREINRTNGIDYHEWVNRENQPLFSRWGWKVGEPGVAPERNAPVTYLDRPAPEPPPRLTLDALNHPIFAWAELESYRFTGDSNRLQMVYEPLVRYYRALQKYLRQGNGLYITDWGSMDNSPRNVFLNHGGTGIDISSEMVLFGRQLAVMARLLGKAADAKQFTRDADTTARLINRRMWDSKRHFYFDLTLEGRRAPVRTIAAYWPLLAQVASRRQARALVAELNNTATFHRLHRVPTLAADEPGYDRAGGYWRGAVWAPTELMVMRGLENYGEDALARDIALQHLDRVAQVFEQTGTIWENYAPETIAPGKPAKKDFVGWSGLGPILFLLEYGIGLKADAPKNELVWRLAPGARVGCERFRFNGHVASLVAEPDPGNVKQLRLSVKSDGAFTLRVIRGGRSKTFRVSNGEQVFRLAK